jgi:nucleoside-diphosphate-sugar epimerase
MKTNQKIVLPGGAGLVGQNLVARLRARGYSDIVVLDKHRANLATLKAVQPDVTAVYADLSQHGDWQQHFSGAGAVVMLQAQIGGNELAAFEKNNVESTRLVLETIQRHQVPYLIHISSSVIKSVADDFYTNTKKSQEDIVLASGVPCTVLRPTLMFGWFDRKHLGWLSRFMAKVPVFPIPGHGRYMRQPLYVGDFCNVIISCLEKRIQGGVYNISGLEQIDYIDIIKTIKAVTGARSRVVRIPYSLFYALLWVWGLFDRNPPFTTQQLAALTASDEFEVIDWPSIFGVRPTPFKDAVHETFTDPTYSEIVLQF